MLSCVIVDAYGPGMFFVELLKNMGYEVIHIQSTKTVPAPFSLFIENAGFIEKITYDNNLNEVINSLKKYASIACVIPGFETGVMLADLVSEKLNLKTNGTALSAARRNKFEMMEALRLKNIPTVQYLKTNKVNEAIEWVNEKANYPAVVKPIDSASSEDVYICNNNTELKSAFDKMLNKKNMMGSDNNEILVQSYLEGTEYVVNSVSCEGIHSITDIWICKKRIINNRVIYDKEELIPFDGKIQALLVSYILKVLDALGIQYGPAHSEIILTKDGPILLETGARIGGAVHPVIHNDCFGRNQIDLTIDAYLDPVRFMKISSEPYKIKKFLYVVMAISKKEGLIKDIPLLNELKNLAALCYVRLKKKPGDKLQKTVDLNTSPATIYLALKDKDKLEAEYQKLLSLCENGFVLE